MQVSHERFHTRNGQELAGILHHPVGDKAFAYALYAHCFTCTKSINAATRISKALARQGIATLRFDFTGLGASEGEFSETNFTSNIDDLVDAANFLSETYAAPRILVGHSLGGLAVLHAASQIDSVQAIASIAAPASPAHILHALESGLDTLAEHGEAEIDLAGRPFTFRQSFVEDAKSHTQDLRALRKAVLLLHSPVDETVSIDEAQTLYKNLKHPKSFVTLDHADHLLSRAQDAEYAAQMIASWATRYIAKGETPPPTPHSVTVTGDMADGFLTAMQMGAHSLIADEPKDIGGKDEGPSPYDLLAGALGACTSMTLNMYARRKKLDLKRVQVQVNHSKADTVSADGKRQKVDVFTRIVFLEGDLTNDVRQRLLEIADMCPVHRTLSQSSQIVTQAG